MTPPGPVSAFLEDELRTWVRRHGIVVWLDLDGHYTGLVDRLRDAREQGGLPYAVFGFRGSHLALMLELEGVAGGVDRTPVLIHLPGFTEDTVRRTPLLELYAAGVRFRKKLDTLVTEAAAGRVPPEQIAAFRAQDGLTLAMADAWLADELHGRAGGGLGAQVQAMRLPGLVDDLLSGGFVASRLREPTVPDALWQVLEARTGLTAAWRSHALPPDQVRPSDVAFVVASWALAVEYVDDLKRAPVDPRLGGLGDLPRGVIDACRELAAHLRERHGGFYQRTADETEGWLADEVLAARAEDLGKVDTFRFEEDRVLEAALRALAEEQWGLARQWAEARVDGASFWLREQPARRAAWQLIQGAVLLGQALAAAGPKLGARSLDQAVERYVAVGAAVDLAHRHLEQRRTTLLFPQLPEFQTLRARLDELRELWRTWADEVAREFGSLCQAQGFLPAPALQQRNLFDEVVRPLTQEPGTTALFMVDALRFEMGQELFAAIVGTPATTAHLQARLAELPTVTSVGMNVLAPVTRNGRLTPVLTSGEVQGFASGEFQVTGPDTRNRAMWNRVGGGTCPWLKLQDVLDRDSTRLKQAVARAKLVIIHSDEIDSAGENGVGAAVFDTVMQKLRAAWRLLRDAGVRRFVFTSDHGFLLLDDSVRSTVPHGRKIDPKRRHVLSPVPADPTGQVRVALTDLGYDGAEGQHLMFPASTAVFDTGNRGGGFVHGGNSLQERVIPVLTVVHRASTGGDMLQYDLSATAREAVAHMHCLAARVDVRAQGHLAFGGTREVELALRVVEDLPANVELCQARGGARLVGGAVQARVGEEFELFFKITGPQDARVQVELHHAGAMAEVTPCVPDARFAVTATARTPEGAAVPSVRDDRWLEGLEAGVRQLFAHLAAHGTVTEDEAQAMLGGARALRRFSARFEEQAAKAPFPIRIDTVGGVKRYVREGSHR